MFSLTGEVSAWRIATPKESRGAFALAGFSFVQPPATLATTLHDHQVVVGQFGDEGREDVGEWWVLSLRARRNGSPRVFLIPHCAELIVTVVTVRSRELECRSLPSCPESSMRSLATGSPTNSWSRSTQWTPRTGQT